MVTCKPQRTPAEIEDIILRKILLVSLVDSLVSDTRIVYLEMTAADDARMEVEKETNYKLS
ncbi:hypothetical protein KY285_028229 [Solanum tuberosum]|nr:hypothetical protein KY285_028229 [Solanum tuberosum]